MARNREPVKPVESQSDSDEEEEVDGSSEEADSQESDSEPEQTQTQTQTPTLKKSQPQMPTKSQHPPPPLPQSQKPHSSSDEEDSGSETDDSEESDRPVSNVKPLASKQSQKSSTEAKKARSKPNEPVTPTKSAAAKRSAEDTTLDKDSKKKKTAEPDTSEKKSLFQRLWTEDDEIVILEGMIDYRAKFKLDPMADLNAFHDFIKKNLHIEVSKTQLQDKIRRLKKKYENNKKKETVGKERTFSKPHEQKAYDLSITIWGNGTGKENVGEKLVGSPKANGSVARKTSSKKVNSSQTEDEVKDVKNGMVVSGEGEKLPVKKPNLNSGGMSLEERMLIAGRGLDGEQEWEELRAQELQLYLKQLELRVAQTKLVLDMMKARDH